MHPMSDTSGPATDAAPSLREFIYHAYYHRLSALMAGAIVLATALLVAALLPPSYRAKAILAVLPAPEFTVRAAAGSHELNASALAMDQIMKAETEILESDDLHRGTMQQIGPARLYPGIYQPTPHSLPRRWLHAALRVLLSPWRVTPADQGAAREERGLQAFQSDLKVLPAKDANVITVTFDSERGLDAAATLNLLLSLYAARRSQLYDDPQLDVVRREAEDGARKVAQADAQLAAFKRDHDISDYDAQRDLLLRRRSETDQAADDAAAHIGEHQARLAALSGQLSREQPTIGVFTEQDTDARLLAINAGLAAVRARLAAAREKYRETSRMVGGIRAELAAQETEQALLRHDATLSVVRQGRNPAIDPLRLDRAREMAELAASRARFTAEQQETARLSAALAALDTDAAEMAALQRQRGSADDNYRTASRILAERHLSEAEDAHRLANVRVIQPASVPQTPRATSLLVIAAGLLFGVLATAGTALIGFYRRPVFFTGEGLAAATGVPVLAVLFQDSHSEAGGFVTA
jgi:uncharacterized protein involved in exopolysaccharide biosynthesis